MAKFCGKCGSKLDEATGLCPKCEGKEKHTGRRVITVILVLAMIAGGVGIAGWKLGLPPFGNKDEDSATDCFTLLTDSFTDRKITDQASALAAIGDVADTLGIEDVSKEFSECKVNTVSGNTYYRFYQEYKGIPVYGRSVIVAADGNGDSLSLSGNYFGMSGLDITPKIDEAAAIEVVQQYYGEDVAISSEGLTIYSLNDFTPELAWKIDICTNEVMEFYLISAENGDILQTINQFDEYSNRETLNNIGVKYSVAENDQLYLTDSSRGIVAVKLSKENEDSDSDVEQLPQVICNANDDCDEYVTALKNLVTAYDFFLNKLNLCSFDGNKGRIYLIFCEDEIKSDNAAGNGHNEDGYLIVGTPDKIFLEPIGNALDIIGHEYTHMVMHKIVDFTGTVETKALSEGIADIFGNLIEIESCGDSDRVWQLGEDAGYSKYSMADYIDMDSFNLSDKDGHSNAAIISHVAYLMSTGVSDASNLQALTTEDIAHLFYGTLYTLPSDCTFSQFRTLVQNQADIMWKQGRLSYDQTRCVSNAFFQVGIDASAIPVSIDNLVLDVYGVNGLPYENYTLRVRRNYHGSAGEEKVYMGNEVTTAKISFPTGGIYELYIEDNANPDNHTSIYVNVLENGGTSRLPVYTECGTSKIDGPITEPSSGNSTPLEAYIEAADKTTATGSWTEDMTMEAQMLLKDGSSTVNAKVNMDASVDISGWNGTDTSSLYMSGWAKMSVLDQEIAYTMTWKNGMAHYKYTKPTVTEADMEVDPSFFNIHSLTEDMILSSSVSGNQIELTVKGDELTKIGVATAGEMLQGVTKLSYSDADVRVSVNSDTGAIDTVSMTFSVSMTIQGYDASAEYTIEYQFLNYGNSASIIPGADGEGADKRSIWLDELQIVDSDRYTGNMGDSFVGKIGTRNDVVDTEGNVYEHGLEAWIARWNYQDESSWAWSTYDLGGEYSTLSGTVGLLESCYNKTDFNTTLEIWGDDALLYSCDLLPDMRNQEVCLDITGVKQLKISLYDNKSVSGGTAFALGNFKLWRMAELCIE